MAKLVDAGMPLMRSATRDLGYNKQSLSDQQVSRFESWYWYNLYSKNLMGLLWAYYGLNGLTMGTVGIMPGW